MRNFEFDFSSSLAVRPVVFSRSPLTEDEQRLHERAQVSAARYAEAESELLRVISAVDTIRYQRRFSETSSSRSGSCL